MRASENEFQGRSLISSAEMIVNDHKNQNYNLMRRGASQQNRSSRPQLPTKTGNIVYDAQRQLH
jgi:hypothetical protein